MVEAGHGGCGLVPSALDPPVAGDLELNRDVLVDANRNGILALMDTWRSSFMTLVKLWWRAFLLSLIHISEPTRLDVI
eukprot:10836346-Prorocentrum_lima.AAC.1